MPSGIIDSLTFTPTHDGDVIVTCRYEAQGTSGGDWGSAYFGRAFRTQSASTVYGNQIPLTTARLPFTVRHVFTVVAGSTVEVGLYGEISGAVAASFWNIDITAHLIKR